MVASTCATWNPGQLGVVVEQLGSVKSKGAVGHGQEEFRRNFVRLEIANVQDADSPGVLLDSEVELLIQKPYLLIMLIHLSSIGSPT